MKVGWLSMHWSVIKFEIASVDDCPQRSFDYNSSRVWNTVIDVFVDNFVVTDDGDNMYVDLNGVYSLVNG